MKHINEIGRGLLLATACVSCQTNAPGLCYGGGLVDLCTTSEESSGSPVDAPTDSPTAASSSSESGSPVTDASSGSQPDLTTGTTAAPEDSTSSETTAPPPTDETNGPMTGTCGSTKLLCEDFVYVADDELKPEDGWIPDIDIGTGRMHVVSPGLAFAGHPGSDVGHAVRLEEAIQEGPRRYHEELTDGKLFVAFTLNVDPGGPAYSRRLLGITTPGGRCGTVVVQSDRAIGGKGDHLALGLDVASGVDLEFTSAYTLSPNVTYTVVFEKDLVDAEMQLYLLESDTPIPDWPPTPLLPATYFCDPVSNGIALGNAAFGLEPFEVNADGLRTTLDGIRVAKAWSDLWLPE